MILLLRFQSSSLKNFSGFLLSSTAGWNSVSTLPTSGSMSPSIARYMFTIYKLSNHQVIIATCLERKVGYIVICPIPPSSISCPLLIMLNHFPLVTQGFHIWQNICLWDVNLKGYFVLGCQFLVMVTHAKICHRARKVNSLIFNT